jgi:predicted neutral ceramidase superfamily lipid hydrolase
MAKKKKETQVVNVQNLNLEIDYDKLADAMVRSLNTSEKEKDVRTHVLTSSMAVFLAVLFGVIFVALVFMAILVGVAYFNAITTDSWIAMTTNMQWSVSIILWLAIIVMVSAAIVMLLSAIEIWKEKDKNYILSAFSGIVGFAALIVALIALVRG